MNRAIRTTTLLFSWLLSQTPSGAAELAYYRFEEGTADTAATAAYSILDSAGSIDGTPVGSPMYRSSVPVATIPQTAQSNNLCLQFSGGQSIFFDTTFLLHDPAKEATFEFFINAPWQHTRSMLWSRSNGDDVNRFNLEFWEGDLHLDYREPGGAPHYGRCAVDYPLNTWAHIAFTRSTNGDGTHTYRTYLDGTQVHLDVVDTPNLPTATGWFISGRPGEQFTGYLDEVRISDTALTPSQFLNSVPEPSSLLLTGMSGLLLALQSFRRRGS